MARLTTQQAITLALQHYNAGRLQDAERICRGILDVEPNHPEALHCLGAIVWKLGDPGGGVELIRRAIAIKPDYADAFNNLGNALRDLGQIDEAVEAYRQAVAIRPDFAAGYVNLGNAMQERGHIDQAIDACRRAIALDPNFSSAHNNLGNALKEQGKVDEAIAAYRRAIELRPDFAEAHSNLGNVLRDKGELEAAIAACQRAIALKSNFSLAYNNLGNALSNSGRTDEAVAAYRRAIALRPEDSAAHSNLVYALHFHPAYDAQAIAAEHRQWSRQHAEPLQKFILPHDNNREPERRLRIGYLSPDFREHVVGTNLLQMLSQHDRERFEIICYAQVRSPDATTTQFREQADAWRDIVGLSDEQVAGQICRDKIDILIDLTLHMANNRLLVFARKPAPVQVTYFGYCSTTGLDAIDYRLSDWHLDPPDTDTSCYVEPTIRLPRCYFCYAPAAEMPEVSSLPSITAGYVTFACRNNFAKVSPPVLDVWAEILRQVPRSRLLLRAQPGNSRKTVLDRFARKGVSAEAVQFVEKQSKDDFLRSYGGVDIALDPFPYCGWITTCDALWMGVPVVTLSGSTAVGRGGRTILNNLGLPEMVAHTPEEYVRIAVALAGDRERLANLRGTLRERMQRSPLLDASGLARDVEAAYRQMWRDWCMADSGRL